MSACEIPLQNGQRPDTITPPSTVRPVPRGAQTPAATPRPSPKSASRLEAGRYATSRLLVIAIETHQPAEALPRATASAAPQGDSGRQLQSADFHRRAGAQQPRLAEERHQFLG